MLLVILDSFPDKTVVLDSNQLLWHWKVLLLQVALKTDKLGAHGTILTLLELVFFLVKDLVIGLPQMLSKERDSIVARLVVVGKQMHTKLVVDVLCDSLSFIVLLRCFVAMRVLLDALRN